MKRFWIAVVAGFVFILFWGWFYNGGVLRHSFMEVQQLFRTPDEVREHFIWILIGDFGLALAFTMIYASGFAGGGIKSGIKLGIMLEILAVAARCLIYAAQPFPISFLALTTLGGFMEMIGAGIIVGAIYRRVES